MDTAITNERTDRRRNAKKSLESYPKKGSMNILIHLDNHLVSETIYQLLITNGYDAVVMGGRSPVNGFTPHVLLVDITTLTHDLLARYPQAKALLVDDPGIETGRLCATLLSYRMHGILSPHAGLQQVWIDNGSVKALRHNTGAISKSRNCSCRNAEGN